MKTHTLSAMLIAALSLTACDNAKKPEVKEEIPAVKTDAPVAKTEEVKPAGETATLFGGAGAPDAPPVPPPVIKIIEAIDPAQPAEGANKRVIIKYPDGSVETRIEGKDVVVKYADGSEKTFPESTPVGAHFTPAS